MSHIVLQSIGKSFGPVVGVRDISLAIEAGEFVSLLGPSGCGKTTTLNMIAGFFEPDHGEIIIGGQAVQNRPPHLRNLGMVFQHFALFPHMTVFENVAFGLEMRRTPGPELRRRVADALALVRLSDFGERYPRELSGGQSQRVALARAVAIQPTALLLDEPFSSLDAALREQLRREVRDIQRQIGITTIFVTHDQSEALEMSDRIVVMNKGRIEQIGTPSDIYDRSANAFVASFIGQANLLRGRIESVDESGATVVSGSLKIRTRSAGNQLVGEPVLLSVRPEKVIIEPSDQVDNRFAAQFLRRTFLGSTTTYAVAVGSTELILQTQNRGKANEANPGDQIIIGWCASDCQLVAQDG